MDIALALEYLHQDCTMPIVHCDLKPSNVLLDEDMTAYVADFGIAKLLAHDWDVAQTKTLGTIGFIAPGVQLKNHDLQFATSLSFFLKFMMRLEV